MNSPSYPNLDASRVPLGRAGWSPGEVCLGATGQVNGRNGENRILAGGASQTEAWDWAKVLAWELGMLAAAPKEGHAFGVIPIMGWVVKDGCG